VSLDLTGALAGETRQVLDPPSRASIPVLEIEDLGIGTDRVDLVMEANLRVNAGETLCLLGESGCGKSLTCLAVMGLLSSPLAIRSGTIRFRGKDLGAMPPRERLALNGNRIAMIFQDATAALNPVKRVGLQVAEALRLHEGLSRKAALTRAVELLDTVGLADPERRAQDFPHQLSGGMCQRAMIAMAIACKPDLIIADEATTALDVTTQAQILRLLRDLQDETGAAMIFVTHDLGVVAELADRVAVMYSGRIVEESGVDALFRHPAHPYSRGLMACRLHGGQANARRLEAIPGTVPLPSQRPSGCSFRPRCGMAIERCATRPPMLRIANDQRAACHFAGSEP
jgi:peptide/nickel transport system ATP-binding protein